MELIEKFVAFVLYRRTRRLKGFASCMTQRTNFQPMKLFSLTRERRRPRHWKVLSVSQNRITKITLLHIKNYSNGILDLEILGSNMYNGYYVKCV